MKRFLLLVLAAAMAAIVISYTLHSSRRTSSAAVIAILPRETVALAVIPDFNAARTQWQRTDFYAMWQEPALQDFLRKPRRKLASGLSVPAALDDLERLHATDVFLAVMATEQSGGCIIGGFRFEKNAPEAETILASWRTRLVSGGTASVHETSDYEQHRIETVTSGSVKVATASAGEWFLAANDVEELKRLLDRVDGRGRKPATDVASDDVFAAAYKHMPKNYAALIYARPDRLATLIASAAGNAVGASGGLLTAFAEVQSFCTATWFDFGKIRDTTFVATPKKVDGSLSRSSLALGTNETFFFFNALGDLAGTLFNRDASAGTPAALQPVALALSQSGVTPADWSAAFGSEFSIAGDWAADSRWPSIVAAVPVKDAARAEQLSTSFSNAAERGDLTQHSNNGVHYFSVRPTGQLFTISPTIGISDRWLVAGVEAASVEAAIERSKTGAPGLAAVPAFQSAQAMMRSPQQSYAYIDTALLYTRIDAALRPMLLMGAAFVPGINDTVDLGKFPPPEAITKHLSPITMSQSYVDGGYLAESAGPVTVNGMFAGMVVLGGVGTSFYQQQMYGTAGSAPWRAIPGWPRATASPQPATPTSTP